MPDQLNIFLSFDEAGPNGWDSLPEPPPTDLDASQLPLVTGGGLIPQGESGALARAITPHSLRKQDRILRYADTVSVAMSRRWKIWWLDLFAGPGAVFDRYSSTFKPGIPAEVVESLRHPLDGYVFSDLSADCVASLVKRLGNRSNVAISQGDANSTPYLESLLGIIPRDALVLAYLDPQGLDLHLETIRRLAWRFRHLDLLVNLPVLAIDRSISAKAFEPVKRVLEHPDPERLLAGRKTASNIRIWFKEKLAEMGYPQHLSVGETIRSENGVPQYDLLLASRSQMAINLYRRANQNDSEGQRSFGFAV